MREDFIKTEDFCGTAVSLTAEGSSHSSFGRMQFCLHECAEVGISRCSVPN